MDKVRIILIHHDRVGVRFFLLAVTGTILYNPLTTISHTFLLVGFFLIEHAHLGVVIKDEIAGTRAGLSGFVISPAAADAHILFDRDADLIFYAVFLLRSFQNITGRA